MKSFFKKLSIFLIIVSVPFSVYLLEQKTNFFGKASGTNANLEINTLSVTGPNKDSWRNLAQGGEERGRMLLPVLDKVKALRPKYIRIDHVFDSYTDAELDQTIMDIQATGAKPFIALSYMPPALAKGGNITEVPNDWNQWESLVQRTVERISGKSGLNITDVYYEVWNEPDLFGKFKTSGSKNYLDLYSHTVRAVMRAKGVNQFKIGGPAITGYYPNWLAKLVSYSQNNGLRLDFLSWHTYSKDLEVFEESLVSVVRYPNMEFVISELGPNSENDPVYDTNFSAIHTIATSVLLDNSIDKLFNFEIKDGIGKDKYWGRWGMLTHEKWGTPEIKPRYKAMQFLNILSGGENIGVVGNGSWVKAIAKKQKNKIQILIVNYDKTGKHSEAVPLKITNLPSNNFNLKRIDFNGQTTQANNITVDQNTYETTMFFSPNTATILEISF